MSASSDALRLTTELFDKVRSGTLQEVAAVLNQGADIDFQSPQGDHALFLATQYGRLENAELLIMRGAKIDNGGRSPLFTSVIYNDTKILSLLLQHKAQVNGRNFIDSTPLHVAASWSHAESARLLFENKADYTLENSNSETPMDLIGITPGMRQFLLDQIEKDKRESDTETDIHEMNLKP